MVIATSSVATILLVVAWAYCHSESYCIFWPSIDTVYAPGYSEEDFGKIDIGMTMDEVDSIMCVPLDVYTYQDGKVHVFYTADGKCRFGDFAWLGRSLILSNNQVIAIQSRIYYD